MIGRLTRLSVEHGWLVLAIAVAAASAGILAERTSPRDVIPDLSDPQIVLVAEWMGHPAPEVSTVVTEVLTAALAGVPGATAIRGTSMTGMAYVDVVFAAPSQLGDGRAEIARRVEQARTGLPGDVRIQVGPEASSTGWVLQYALVAPVVPPMMGMPNAPTSPLSLLTLRRFQDDVLRPALAAIPGVAEVAAVGGEVEQLLVEVDAERLRQGNLAFSEIAAAVRARIDGRPGTTLDELAAASIAGSGDRPHQIGDVARLRVAPDMAAAAADFGGFVPAVGGIVIARRDADLTTIADEAKRVLANAAGRLPAEAELVVVYDRAALAGRVEDTLLRALGEEVAVLAAVVLVFLLHAGSALVPLLTVPLVVLITFAAMRVLGVAATVMSLGGIGIALGMAVDAEVVALEACHRRLERDAPEPGERRGVLLAAAGSFTPAVLTSLVIAALTFLPVFAFSGETGRLLRPLALTKTLVIAAAALVTATVAPTLRDRLLRGRIVPEFAHPLTRGLVRLYRPFVHFALDRPSFTLATAGLALLSCLPIAARLGGEFLPPVDEGDLLFMPTTAPGVPPELAAAQMARQNAAIRTRAEVATVFGKVGRAETATDPAPFAMAETTIALKPRAAWPAVARSRWYTHWAPAPLQPLLGLLWPPESPATTAELVAELDRATRLPGWTNAWTAPARARMDMMATGVRTPVGLRVVAADPARSESLAAELRTVVARVPGTRSAFTDAAGGESRLTFATDPTALARHGADAALVRATADLIVAGGQVGEVVRGDRRLRVRVVPDVSLGHLAYVRPPDEALREATVRTASGAVVPLALLGRPVRETVPAAIRVERGELVAYVYVDLDQESDVRGYVARARRTVDTAIAAGDVTLAPGERIEWTGQYELLAAGQRRLAIIAPIVALSMLALLWLQFRSCTEALLVLTSVPFALVGSVWTLWLLDYRLSAPVWVGLLSVVGLAMQTGVVMVVYIDEAFHRRVREGRLRDRADIVAAHAEGTVRRLRPKLMTITTMAAALLPFLWTEGAGSEIMKRVAAPMVGGLVTSAFLTLEVIPVLYTIWRHHQLRRAQQTGRPIAEIVGHVPSWARS